MSIQTKGQASGKKADHKQSAGSGGRATKGRARSRLLIKRGVLRQSISQGTGAAPAFMVVFTEPSAANAAVLADLLQVKEEAVPGARPGCLHFSCNVAGRTRPRLFERLGVACADLAEDARERLGKHSRVRCVVPNEARSVHGRPEAAALAASSARPGPRPLEATLEAGYGSGITLPGEARTANTITFGQPTPAAGAAPWHLSSIGAGRSASSGQGVKVGVIDTGIDLGHPDFVGRFVDGVNAKSFVPGESIADRHGHGTHVAGLVGGPAVPKSGQRYGVAPGTDLLIAKALDQTGHGLDDHILDAIDWAIDQGARIISLSLYSVRLPGQPFSPLYEQVALTHPGVLFVAAAGNESFRQFGYLHPVCNPAACPSIMAVGAVDHYSVIAPFSCATMDGIGKIDIAGPGMQVYSAWNDHGYWLDSGTSMAAPIVAGVAASIASANPTLDASGLWKALAGNAVSFGLPDDYGAGVVRVS